MRIEDVRRLTPLQIFLYFIRERHQIYLRRRAGLPAPWTDDEILQSNFFTNPYREHDKTTVWFRENVRDPWRDDSRVVLAVTIARWFNFVPTVQVLISEPNLLLDWSEEEALARLRPIRSVGGQDGQIFTGAFMVNSPPGEPKLEAVCRRITKVWKDRRYLISQIPRWTTMQFAHSELKRYEGIGGFGAYEVVCDLRYTHVLENANDKMIWSNPGPGAIRGLMRVLGREIKNKSNAASPPVPKDWEARTRELLALVQGELRDLPPFEMREVEMTLCEVDKLIRLLRGEGKSKRTFNGRGNGSGS